MSDSTAHFNQRIAVLGAGQIGAVLAGMLAEQGHRVTLADATLAKGRAMPDAIMEAVPIDAADGESLRTIMRDKDIVVSALPYFLNNGIAAAAVETGTHYFDLTEDVATTSYIKSLVSMTAESGPLFFAQKGPRLGGREARRRRQRR